MAAAGSRFEGYVREAMGEAEVSLAELSRRSGVKETNWHGWFRGEHRPRPNSLVLASRVLNRTPEQMLARWDGERPAATKKAPVEDEALVLAIRELTAAILTLTPLSAPPLAEAAQRQDALTDASSSPARRRARGRPKGR